jgi:hypothetical protein
MPVIIEGILIDVDEPFNTSFVLQKSPYARIFLPEQHSTDFFIGQQNHRSDGP